MSRLSDYKPPPPATTARHCTKRSGAQTPRIRSDVHPITEPSGLSAVGDYPGGLDRHDHPHVPRLIPLAQVGAPVLGAHLVGEGVVVILDDLGVASQLNVPVGVSRVRDQQAGMRVSLQVLGLLTDIA